MGTWLARSTPELAVPVRALAGDIVVLSAQVYKWVFEIPRGVLRLQRGS